MTALPIPGDQLVDHVQALRALARRLLRDAHAVDDVVQDTVLLAMTRPGPRAGGLPAWLATILRNTIRQRNRTDRRRARREMRSADATDAPSAATAATQLDEGRRLLAFVQELDEAQRHAVFLHFWHGMTAREIATALSIPTKTVHSRIERGLARLRVRLDGGPDGGPDARRAWMAAIAAFADLRPPFLATTPAASALLLMKNKLLIAASAIALLVLPPCIAPGLFGGAAPMPTPGPGAAAASPLDSGADAKDSVANERTAIVDATPGHAPAESPPPPLVHGNVRDLTGAGVANVTIVFERMNEDKAMVQDLRVPATTSDDAGRFALPLPAGDGRLSTGSEHWAAVLRPWLRSRLPAEPPTIVVAPSRSYAGTVVDTDGQPIVNARVVVDIDADIVATREMNGRPIALPSTLDTVHTDARGQFEFARLGFVPGARLVAEFETLQSASITLPEASARDLLLRLGPPDPAMHLFGIVLRGDGRPLRGALVAVGGDSVKSGDDGRFSTPWAFGQRPTFVRAAHPEHGAVQETFTTGPGLPGWRSDNPITIRLPSEPGVVTGHVLAGDGRALPGIRVWTPDVTYLGTITRSEQGHELSGGGTVEAYANDGSAEWSLATVTDGDGAFTLRGLLPRSYAFFAMDPQTLNATGPVHGAPGDDLEIVLPAATLRRVAGRAISRSGNPLPGLRVARGRALTWQPPERVPDPWAGCPMRQPGASHLFRDDSVETDAEGRFEFAALATDGTYLWFSGDSIFPAPSFRLTAELDLEALEVVLPARSTFRVELQQPGEADGFRLEQDGRHRTLLVRVEGFEMSMGKVDLVGGISPPAYAAAGEATVVLVRGDEVVRRIDVMLPEGTGHVVRL